MKSVIELAKQAGYDETSETIPSFHQFIERFAALVRAEREWVDLTDDEIAKLKTNALHQLMSLSEFAHAVIAAWKAKNGIN